MIRKCGNYKTEERFEMRGGSGTVRIEHIFTPGEELKAPTRLCAKLTLEPGVSIGFHKHETEEELFHIISGSAEVDDNGTMSQVCAGDSIITGNGSGHSIRNTGNGNLEILAVITKFAE